MEESWIIYLPGWILAGLATIAGLISAWFAITRIGIRPEISVYLTDGSTSITLKEGNPKSLMLEFENKGRGGRFPLRRDTLHEIAIAIYFPSTYELIGIQRQKTTYPPPYSL